MHAGGRLRSLMRTGQCCHCGRSGGSWPMSRRGWSDSWHTRCRSAALQTHRSIAYLCIAVRRAQVPLSPILRNPEPLKRR